MLIFNLQKQQLSLLLQFLDLGRHRIDRRRLHDGRARKMLPDPRAALREGLRMRVERRDLRERRSAREEAVCDREDVLLANAEVAFEERIGRHADGALGRVLGLLGRDLEP